MSAAGDELSQQVRVTDPGFFCPFPHEVFRQLRAEEPVYWSAIDKQWVLTKYDDIRWVSKNTELFSNLYDVVATGAVLAEDDGEPVAGDMPRHAELRRRRVVATWGLDTILGSDGERHSYLRQSAKSPFLPRAVTAIEERLERFTEELLDELPSGATIDIIDRYVAQLPMLLIADILGVDTADIPRFRKWSDAFVDLASIEQADPAEIETAVGLVAEFREYLSEQLQSRIDTPTNDLLTALAQTRDSYGDPMSLIDQLTTAQLILIAGNETTRTLLAAALRLLCEHPGQRQLLLDSPGLIPGAVEEFLRYASPVTHMCRTALDDITLRGRKIRRGDYLCMVYPSGNRDEEIWPDADVLDVTRPTQPPHLGFGHAEHFCLGAPLARLESRIALSQFLQRFPRFRLAGDVELGRNPMTPGIVRMPMVLN